MRLLENNEQEEIYIGDEEPFIPEHQNIALKNNRNEFIFLCIDVGIKNLGLSLLVSDFEYNLINVMGVECVDITKFNCDRKTCPLQHDNICVDWVNHFFHHFDQAFEECNHIIIERQPPSGLVVIEQLLMSKYRTKTTLVHPASMHKFFSINTFSYEERKKYTEKIAIKYIHKDILEEYNSYNRKHDIADSICLGIFWLNNIKKEFEKYKIGFNMIKNFEGLNINDFFNQFKMK
jgi:hypothetical protein